ncbi:hypothetical protein DFH07DRAFT_857579 [Mycena maculata]|uniref:MYND-type domain-containing protein n=1 Tax=Mycena maculata TaxID=230809 RepID=A0AAD7HJ58_9AGAR|nr:hypothetical protein DFH07DRAFT_857579 [Mycena maculata]
MAMDFLESDDFAVVLGLKTSIYPERNLADGQEFERHRRLMFYLRRNSQESEAQRDVVWSRFCALYLPATINRLLSLSVPTDAINAAERDMIADFSANNPWHEMLVQIQHIPYLAKYLRSSNPIAAPGKHLPQLLAERLAAMSGRWDRKMLAVARSPSDEDKRQYYIAATGSAVQLLSTLCTHYINERDRTTVISSETQQNLLPFLLIWSRRYHGQFLGDVSSRMIAFVSGEPTLDQEFNRVRRSYKNWDVCGLPSCNVRKALKVCARCQTVRYCSPDHQRIDWSQGAGSLHKYSCFRTEY